MAAVNVTGSTDVSTVSNSGRVLLRNSSGVPYIVINNTTDSSIDVWKGNGTTPTSFAEQDENNNPAGTLYGAGSAAIDSNNIIHIAYMSDQAATSKLYYARFRADGTNDDWLETDTTLIADIGEDPVLTSLFTAITIDSSDVPHIAFTPRPKITGGTTYTVEYINKVGGSWGSTVDVKRVKLKDCGYIDITIDYDDKPCISLFNITDSIVIAAIGSANDPSSFTLQELVTVSSSLYGTSICVNNGGDHWVAYIGDTNYVSMRRHAQADGWSTWDSAITESDIGRHVSLAADGTNIYVFYEDDQNDIVYNKYSGSAWDGESALDIGTFNTPVAAWAFAVDNDSAGALVTAFTPGSTYTRGSATELSFVYADEEIPANIWFNVLSLSTGTTYYQNPSGAMTSSGNLSRQPEKFLAASFSNSGVLTRHTALSFLGAMLNNGLLSKSSNKSFSGNFNSSGSVTYLKLIVRSFVGAMTNSGSLVKTTTKNLAGSLANSGTVIKNTFLSYAGSMVSSGELTATKAGAAVRSILRWTLHWPAALDTITKDLAGSMDSSGDLTKSTFLLRLGSMDSSGTLTRIGSFLRSFSGQLSSSGLLTRASSFMRQLSGSMSSSGTVSVNAIFARLLSGVMTSSGDLLKQTNKSFTGFLSNSGILTRAGTFYRSLVGQMSSSGAVSYLKVFVRFFSGSMDSSGTVAITTIITRFFSGVMTSSGDLLKQTNKSFTGFLSSNGVLTRIGTFYRSFVGQMTSSGDVSYLKVLVRFFTGSMDSSGTVSVSAIFARFLSGVMTSSGDLLKQTNKSFTGFLSSNGVLTRIGTFYRSFVGQMTSSGDVSYLKVLVRFFTGSMDSSGTLSFIRNLSRTFTGVMDNSGAIIKTTFKSFAGSTTSWGQVVKQWALELFGDMDSIGTLSRLPIKYLTGITLSEGKLTKRISKRFSGLMASAGNLAKTMSVALWGIFDSSGTIRKATNKVINGTMDSVGALVKQTAVNLEGNMSSAGVVAKTFFISLAGAMSSAGSLLTDLNIVKVFVSLTFKARDFGYSLKERSFAKSFKERLFNFFIDDRDLK